MADTLGVKLTNVDSAVLEASHIIRAAPGILYGIHVTNTNAAVRYLQFFDSTTLPADGAVPVGPVVQLPIGLTVFVDFGVYGRSFATGIVVCNSSTPSTKTIGAADSWFAARVL